jgi:hypothetical protein
VEVCGKSDGRSTFPIDVLRCSGTLQTILDEKQGDGEIIVCFTEGILETWLRWLTLKCGVPYEPELCSARELATFVKV